MTDIVICEPIRTPVGRFGGALSTLDAAALASGLLQELVRRTGLQEGDVDEPMPAVLLMNIALTRGAYDVQGVQRDVTLLSEREQALTERLAAEAAPARLSERATALGMVPSTSPAFIRLSDGAVLGVPQPAEAPVVPTVEPVAAAPSAPPVATPEPDVVTD